MNNNYLSSFLIFVILLSCSALQAHEPRQGVSDHYTIIVGNRFEPPYAGQMNKFDMFVRDLEGNPVEIEEMDLTVKILFLEKENFDARVIAKARLKGDLKEDRETAGRFNIDYLPKVRGTYGYKIKGTINGVYINEKFVCGEGTINPDSRSFSCVEKLQEFPSRRRYGW